MADSRSVSPSFNDGGVYEGLGRSCRGKRGDWIDQLNVGDRHEEECLTYPLCHWPCGIRLLLRLSAAGAPCTTKMTVAKRQDEGVL